QGQSGCRSCERQREPELDAGEPGEIDSREARPDDLAAGDDVSDGGVGSQLLTKVGGCRSYVRATGIDEEGADRIVAGHLRDVVGVGEQEAVVRRCRELFDDTDVVKRDADV